MDLFGKQARQELEQLQKKMNNLELRHSDLVAKHSRTSEELQESSALVAAINAAKKSKALHLDEKRDHDEKAAEYVRKSKEITQKEAELLSSHEKRKTALTKEMQELEGKVSTIKFELADSQKRAKALEKEIQTTENKRDKALAEIEKLKTGRLNVETALSKLQEKQADLAAVVAKLARQHEALAGSNQHLSQLTSHLNRTGDEDTVFASLEHDLHRFLTHDRTSGAMQVTLKARPLLLVVDFGYDSVNFAAVRVGLLSGGSEISLHFESRKIVKNVGGSRIEALFAAWLWKQFTTVHPRLKKSVKQQKGVELSLPVAQRLLALLCQGAPQGEVEETIVIDNEPFSTSIPLRREELVSIFLSFLGADGELTGAIRRFLAECKLTVNAIDRIVCLGIFGQLPLLDASLANIFNQPVFVTDFIPTLALAEQKSAKLVTVVSSNEKRASVIMSDPERTKKEREDRLRYEKELVAKLTKERIEQEERERKEQEERERLARKEQERLEREKQEKEKLERQNRERKEKEERDRQEKIQKEKEILERQKRAEREHEDAVKRKKGSPPAYYSCPVTRMGFEFVKGGSFQMGDIFDSGSENKKPNMPVHAVTVSDFLMGKYPVTQGEWKKVMGSLILSDVCRYPLGDCYPVVFVSFDEVQGFIRKLNQQTGKSYRLPTEAEWEYAARSGGKKELFSGGNNADDVAWHKGNSDERMHPVGLKIPNGLGLYDMCGNISEWVNDWSRPYKYIPQITSPQKDPQGPPSSSYYDNGVSGLGRFGDYRVIRGGRYYFDEKLITTVGRSENSSKAGFGDTAIGFRLALQAR